MSDFYGGFGNLFKGLSGFMPQDDPDVKIMTTQSDLSDLRKKKLELYAEIETYKKGRGLSGPVVSKCPGCGDEYSPGTKFCGGCGSKL